jgi:hypothetical protein
VIAGRGRSLVAALMMGLVVLSAGLLLAGPAQADAVSDAVAALRTDNIYVAADTGSVTVSAASAPY